MFALYLHVSYAREPETYLNLCLSVCLSIVFLIAFHVKTGGPNSIIHCTKRVDIPRSIIGLLPFQLISKCEHGGNLCAVFFFAIVLIKLCTNLIV